MNKETFLHQLRIRLSQLPEADITERLAYYSEIIDDMVEEGFSEEEAIASFGDINQIAAKIMQDTPLTTLVKTKVKPKNGWSIFTIILVIIGSPLWVPLLLAFLAIVACVYIVIWAAIICVFAIVLGLAVAGGYLLIRGLTMFSFGFPYVILSMGCGLILLGLFLLTLLAAKQIAIWLVQLTRWLFKEIKGLFIKNSGSDKGGNLNEEKY